MPHKIGIPKALMFYSYYPAWEKYFTELSQEIVFSDDTSKKTIDDGVKLAVSESCLPVKTFLGHLVNLKEKKVDYIFCPRIISVESKRYLCPKFLGLPEIARHSVPDLPPLIDIEVNLHKKPEEYSRELHRLGWKFTYNPFKIKRSVSKAQQEEKKYNEKLLEGYTPIDIFNGEISHQDKQNKGQKIAVLGHPYNLYDSHISMNIIHHLRENDIDVITPEMIPEEEINNNIKKLEKDIFWTFGKKLLGAANYCLEEQSIDGMVLIVSFACGPDSLIAEIIERTYKRAGNIPIIKMVLDEHTGEAGFITRLEAFVDLIQWRESKCK